MTLSTDLIILDPVNPESVYAEAMRLLAPTCHGVRVSRGPGKIANLPGQNLAAWLIVTNAVDGPLGVERGEDDYQRFPAPHCVRVNWDTAYGYQCPGGIDCARLHAGYVRNLGAWLDDRGLRWMWRNEFTGQWFTGDAGLETLR